MQNLKLLASFYGWVGQFESYLVGNPEDMFSRDMAHMSHTILLIWATPWENLFSGMCDQGRLNSACSATEAS